jgi:3-(3-hydroxy-phenyl)propionate hydroxylase
MDATEVVIVGAGPVGLSLALGLSRAGSRVLVLEKRSRIAEHSRAPALWPGTQEVLAQLGVLEAIERDAIAVPRVTLRRAADDRALVTLPLDELADETRFPRLLLLPQPEVEGILAQALREAGARLHFNCEVTGVERTAASVTVRYRDRRFARVGAREAGVDDDVPETTVEAAFVAGCDGAHSLVRQTIGAELDGMTYGLQVALADVRFDSDAPFPRIATESEPSIGIRVGERLWRLILPFTPDDERAIDQRVARAMADLFRRPGTGRGANRPATAPRYEVLWQSSFRLHRRISTRLVDGRVALAGDAAHLNSPVGGQGMNAGIQETALLTSALLRALEQNSPRPLEDYAARRRAGVERGVNRFTHRLTRVLLFGRGRFLPTVLRTANAALRIPPLRRRILRRIAMLR